MSDRQPKICFVAPNAFPVLVDDQRSTFIGGAELQQVIIAKGLVERGYQVSMICLDFGQQEMVEIDGITVLRAFKPDEGIPVVRFVWPRLTSIWNCLKRADADVYYQRTAAMLTGVVAAFCRRYNRKSVFAAAGNPDLELDTSRIRFARDRRIYEYGLRNVDRILVQNEEQQDLCNVNFGRKSTLIPNCIPPINPRQPKSICDVLWVSTVRQIKQPELYLDLAEAMPDYRFRMIGGPDCGDSRLFHAVKCRAAKIANVEFLGFVQYSKADEHFNGTSVFVNTSISEGFPNTFLQAWARGVPTVSFVDCGAHTNRHSVGSCVKSFGQMASCVAEWLANESERKRVGAQCREYVQRIHSQARVLDLYESILADLVEIGT